MTGLIVMLLGLLVGLLILRAAPPIVWLRYRHGAPWRRAVLLFGLAFSARRTWLQFCKDRKLAKLVKEGRVTTREALWSLMPGVRVERREGDRWTAPKLKISPFRYGLRGWIKTTSEVSHEDLFKNLDRIQDQWGVSRLQLDHDKPGRVSFVGYRYEPLEEAHPSPLLDAKGELAVRPGEITSADDIRLLVDQNGHPIDVNLRSTAHGLLAGITRSGKSITANTLLASASLMSDVRLVIIDPNLAAAAPWYRTAYRVCTDTHPSRPTEILREVRDEMEKRQDKFWDGRTDRLTEFDEDCPLWLVVIDEITNYSKHSDKKAREAFTAELLAVASQAAKFGVRLWLIAQKPSADVLPTAVRTNLSTRICHRVDTIEDFQHLFQDARDLTITAADREMPQGVAVVHVGAMKTPVRAKGVYLPTEACWSISDALVEDGQAVRELPGTTPATVLEFPESAESAA